MGENWYFNRLYQRIFHYGPAHCVDIVCRAVGSKPFLVKVSDLMQKSSGALETFTTNSWSWSNTNTVTLEADLTEEDRSVFGFDIRQVDWRTYLDLYAQGIRDYVFQEDPTSQPACRRKLWLLYILDWTLQVGIVLSILFFLCRWML